jgi:hypothetical protein
MRGNYHSKLPLAIKTSFLITRRSNSQGLLISRLLSAIPDLIPHEL